MLHKTILVIVITLIMLCGCSDQKRASDNGPVSNKIEITQDELNHSKNEPSDVNKNSTQDKDTDTWVTHYITVKYRDTPVDVAAPYFEYLNTEKSSFIRGAWYDKSNGYMVINLDGVCYHYCGMPVSVWKNFSRAESFGSFYHQHIKGQYDCREGYVPGY